MWLWVDFLGLGCCGFYFCGCGLALRSEFLALISFFFWLIIRGLRLCLVAEKMKENHSFYWFRDKPMNPIWHFGNFDNFAEKVLGFHFNDILVILIIG